jgi:hypothetical protein
MSVGLLFRSPVPQRRFAGLIALKVDILGEIEQEAERFAKAKGLGIFFDARKEGDAKRWIRLHAAGEPVEVHMEGVDVVLSANTSAVGPGYHCLVVDLLDHLSDKCGLQWGVSGPEGDEGDETKWFDHRSFQAMRAEMSLWLKRCAEIDVQVDRRSTILICLPLNFESIVREGPKELGRILSQQGPVNFELLERLAAAEEPELSNLSEDWFIWPRREMDATFWVRTGEVLLWNDVQWRAPLDEPERKVCQKALTCYETAHRLDPSILVPEADLTELRELMSSPVAAYRRPRSQGIGYARCMRVRPLPGDWSIEIPGYWYLTQDDDGLRYNFGEIVIWATSWDLDFEEDATNRTIALMTEKDLVAEPFAHGSYRGMIYDIPNPADTKYLVRGYVAISNRFLMLSCCFDDAGEHEQARRIIKSARCNKAER